MLHFTQRNYLPYHSGHTVYFQEATMYLCDDDETSAIVQNRDDEYFVVTDQSDCEQVCHDSQFQSPGGEQTRWQEGRASDTRKGQQYKTLLAGMLAIAIAFGFTIPLGFWLRPRYPAMPDQVFSAILVIILFGIAAGVMRLLGISLWPAKRR
jgi:hypothetical protein